MGVSSSRVSRAMVLALAGACAAAPATATTVAVTDDDWLVTTALPGSGWNTDLSFDDSGWATAAALPGFAPYTDGVGEYIWAPCDTSTTLPPGSCQFSADPDIWLRHEFTLSQLPLSAWLSGGVDDDATVYLNGTLVLLDQNTVATNLSLDVTPYLVAGTNLFAVYAHDDWNWSNNFWHNHALRIRVEGEFPIPDPEQVPEPGSPWLMLGGLLALFGMRRRIAGMAA